MMISLLSTCLVVVVWAYPMASGFSSLTSLSPVVKSASRSRPFITAKTTTTCLQISSGFSFDDGDQILVSVQKPLGIVLEQDDANDAAEETPVIVAQVDPAGAAAQAGVQVGDVLVAVQNASVEQASLEYCLERIGQAPRVVNLRFLRPLR